MPFLVLGDETVINSPHRLTADAAFSLPQFGNYHYDALYQLTDYDMTYPSYFRAGTMAHTPDPSDNLMTLRNQAG